PVSLIPDSTLILRKVIDNTVSVQIFDVNHYPSVQCTKEMEVLLTDLTAKLLRLDDLVRMENDVMEPKRKRSFPGNNAPLDRLSTSSMETKQAANKQSKAVELPRRRVNPPPIDRIGMSRLPNRRG
uniref:Osteocrin n=1 Tax=Seriola lalandi dorsalis TaxID=1841481 RepID=A0A3B4WFL2_SERLL